MFRAAKRANPVKIEILGLEGCPNVAPAVELARAALQSLGIRAEISEVNMKAGEAIQAAFLGSPTVRVNGFDVEIAARTAKEFGFGCRTYMVNGVRQGTPPQEWIEAAIRETLREDRVQDI